MRVAQAQRQAQRGRGCAVPVRCRAAAEPARHPAPGGRSARGWQQSQGERETGRRACSLRPRARSQMQKASAAGIYRQQMSVTRAAGRPAEPARAGDHGHGRWHGLRLLLDTVRQRNHRAEIGFGQTALIPPRRRARRLRAVIPPIIQEGPAAYRLPPGAGRLHFQALMRPASARRPATSPPRRARLPRSRGGPAAARQRDFLVRRHAAHAPRGAACHRRGCRAPARLQPAEHHQRRCRPRAAARG